jgi:hypothetical protein
VDRAAGSFKLAWQSERTAHQHDLEGAALARKAAEEEARALRESVSAGMPARPFMRFVPLLAHWS